MAFHKMDQLEIDILNLKKQIETAKSPEQKTKLQAELKAKEGAYLVNMWINGGYFKHKVDQFVKPKVDELKAMLKQISEKYESRLEAAEASGDTQAIEKIDAEVKKENDPVNQKLQMSEELKLMVGSLHGLYFRKSSLPQTKESMEIVEARIAKLRKRISELEFRLSDADMAKINLWMSKPWIDLGTN